jgi:hypothetical protein
VTTKGRSKVVFLMMILFLRVGDMAHGPIFICSFQRIEFIKEVFIYLPESPASRSSVAEVELCCDS